MKGLARHLLAVVLAAALPSTVFVSSASGGPVRVSGIRFWTNDEYTRVAIDLSGDARYAAKDLPADPARQLPPRIFVDVFGADVGGEIVSRPLEVRDGLLKVVRAGRFRPGVARIVIDLERESGYRTFDLSDPSRIIVDIEGKAGPAAAPGRRPEARDSVRVMIDPGHGGKDPGAVGPTGLEEKDVVLAVGRLVREKLGRLGGCDVLMTRESDVFIPLEERTARANEARADIFVSLHINASRNRSAEGISTYVLSRGASDREALELAARENGVSVRRLSKVGFIIDDLLTTPRRNESLRLAKTVNDAIVRSVSRGHGSAHDLGLKQAPFFVLVGARMTAVLVETSFISNRSEEARLRDPSYLEAIADGVVEAIRYYARKSATVRADL
ncbi:MAG: N-acetylmuramoyl-L-alanine amidase [Gemmatimonadota bacterium]